MFNPITKFDTDEGPVIVDLAEIVVVKQDVITIKTVSSSQITMLTRDAAWISLKVADETKRLEMLTDIYAKMRKIRDENLQILDDMTTI